MWFTAFETPVKKRLLRLFPHIRGYCRFTINGEGINQKHMQNIFHLHIQTDMQEKKTLGLDLYNI